jgi:DNA-directed RNA polymerase specialized sigma24 family protein
VLLLVAIEHMAYRDVADVLGVSVVSVMTSMGDGRASWRRLSGMVDGAVPRLS